jgi:hypothetical protein
MLRTKSGLPKHCSWNIDRHGKRRVRFRKDGFSTYLTGTPWSEEFMRQYATALNGVKAQSSNIGAGRTIAGTVDALVAVYLDPLSKSSPFKTGAPETQRTRRNILENFRAAYGHLPLFRTDSSGKRTMLLKREHVQRIVNEKSATPFAQRNFLNTIHAMFKWASRIPDDPTLGVNRTKVKTTGYKTWTEPEIERFEAKYPIGTKARLAFALILYTGLCRQNWTPERLQRRSHPRPKQDGGRRRSASRNSVASQAARDHRRDAHCWRQDVLGEPFRQTLHRAGIWKLVPGPMQCGRMFRYIRARRTQSDGSPSCRDRMQRKPDRCDYRPCLNQ